MISAELLSSEVVTSRHESERRDACGPEPRSQPIDTHLAADYTRDVDLTTAAAKVIELAGKLGDSVAEITANDELNARVDRLPTRLGPYGVDPFGFDPEYLKKVAGLAVWIYRHYFRVQASGVSNIPDGRVVLVANHSGQLPFDAAMISVAAFLDREPPVFMRSMLERFVPSTPFASTFMARCGQILGTPENCSRLLEAEEAILVFPEGVRGLNKTFKQRYRLQEFGQGFVRLALQSGAPVVPVAVVGAEEQAPSLYNARAIGKILGFPAFPITPTNPLLPVLGMLPYPSRYRIYFGEPIQFDGDANDEDEVILEKVALVKGKIQSMLDEGVAKRQHIFW